MVADPPDSSVTVASHALEADLVPLTVSLLQQVRHDNCNAAMSLVCTAARGRPVSGIAAYYESHHPFMAALWAAPPPVLLVTKADFRNWSQVS